MESRARFLLVVVLVLFPSLSLVSVDGAERVVRAGAAIVDISPTNYPVLVNAMFTERTATRTVDPLSARAVVLDNGELRLAIAVVDSCMVPRDLIDAAKSEAARSTGIPAERMLISSTHTHSAPSAMGCLGSRADTNYAAFLPGRIAAAIIKANERLRPARVGWAVIEDWDHTFNRRWIRRPDRMMDDPFGKRTVRAHMHPGHESGDVTGPSGPADPALSVVAVETSEGKPLALLANYSQHYYESALVSSDYFGKFRGQVATLLGANDADGDFVGIMSQGTSGDLMWMDYGAPRKQIGYEAYAREIAERVHSAYKGIQFTNWVPLKMAESKLSLNYRVPDAARLEWARSIAAKLEGRLPQQLPEIYALETIHLHERQRTELVLQAVRIGDVGLAGIPNEIYALTGLKLKAQSPLQPCITIGLANGAEGYIPTPEQHKMGGYTTWAARTAGLEVAAEPRIVETVLQLLETVAGKPRRVVEPRGGGYTEAIRASRPKAYWRLEEMVIPNAKDASGNGNDGTFDDGVALYLPGVGSGSGISPNPRLTSSRFSAGNEINRAAHFAGGRVRSKVPIGESYSVELWFWNGLPNNVRPVTGYLFSRGRNEDAQANGDHVGIGGTHQEGLIGRLIFFNGNQQNQILMGKTPLAPKTWYHVVLVRDGVNMTAYVNGVLDLMGEAKVSRGDDAELFIGGRNDNFANFEGKMDEIAVYDRALTAEEVKAHFEASGQEALVPNKAAKASPALSPEESLKKIQVSPGFEVELVAAEPLVLDPVAIDWDASGRLWVVEMADYPMGMDGKGKPGGRVRVLEDVDGDGRYDRSTLFADGLSFPTGILTWRDGVLVTAAPEILFLRDRDGDGKADEKRALFTGFSEGNQQLRVNGLRWGLDNWVYCAMGAHYRGYASSTKVKSGLTGKEVQIGSMDFRFRPDTGEIEAVSGPSQFGRNRDDWGHWFGSQNSRPLWHYVLQDGYLRRNLHVPAPDPTQQVMVPLNPKVFPVSPMEKRFHSFEQAGHFTSGCSGMVYRDTLLFSESDGMQAFACEPFHNLVHREVLQEAGASFIGKRAAGEQQREFFASEDRWCRPVMTLTGPDGAFWVVDMYRYMIEHPDWLPENGKAELLPHYRTGDDKGRIYRVLKKGTARRKPVRLEGLSDSELAAALDSANGWQRDKVQQMLLWRGAKSERGKLRELALHSAIATVRAQALWTVQGLGLVDAELLSAAVRDTHPGVRENGLRVAEKHGALDGGNMASALVNDPAAKVRLQLAFSLGEWKSPSAGEALAALALKDYADPFVAAAVMSSAVPHVETLVARLSGEPGPATRIYAEPLRMLTLALGRRDLLAQLLQPTVRDAGGRFAVEQMQDYGAFLALLQRRRTAPTELATDKGDALDQVLKRGKEMLAFATRVVSENGTAMEVRLAAASLMTRDAERQSGGLRVMGEWIAPQFPIEIQRGALQALAESGSGEVPRLLLARYVETTPQTRFAIIETLLRREPWAWTLLNEVQAAGISTAGFDPAQRARLKEHESKRVRELARKVFGTSSTRAAVIESFRPALQMRGDATRGEVVYAQLCVSCHQRNGQGNEVGPDLKSVVGHAPEKLLANILDPSADVQPGYHAYSCTLKSGDEAYGIIVAETANSVVLKSVDGSTRTILRSDIASLRSSGASLMPEGLESGLTQESLADLIAFLRTAPR